MLDQLWFSGEVRSLIGPIRGEGEFVTGGGLYGYDISAGRADAEGTRLRLSLKTDERPLTVEADGLLAFERGAPRFDGTFSLSRPAGARLASGKAVASEPLAADQQGQGRRRVGGAGRGDVPVRTGRARGDA